MLSYNTGAFRGVFALDDLEMLGADGEEDSQLAAESDFWCGRESCGQ